MLANIYLPYVLDLWAQAWRRQAKGDVVIVRYADDGAVGFQHESEARRFWADLAERFAKFGLELHPVKTRLLEFGRYAAEERKRNGRGKPESFDFLGFTHVCGRTRKGRFAVLRRTSRKRLRRKLGEIKIELRRRLHVPVPEVGKWLGNHTDFIVRGKARTPVEFGHKVHLVECRGGLITDYAVLEGNPPDQEHVLPTLRYHERRFGAPPAMLATDRGFHSAANVAACKEAGVIDCIPQCGGQKTPERQAYEKNRAFKKGQRFRAGIEGRISVLLRGRGMKRCLSHGPERFEVFVGMAVLANNLSVLAALLAKNKPHRVAA